MVAYGSHKSFIKGVSWDLQSAQLALTRIQVRGAHVLAGRSLLGHTSTSACVKRSQNTRSEHLKVHISVHVGPNFVMSSWSAAAPCGTAPKQGHAARTVEAMTCKFNSGPTPGIATPEGGIIVMIGIPTPTLGSVWATTWAAVTHTELRRL